ncbi:Uncharacterized protein Rs2_41125 [Raphanus sativus]|nr:Uncharacterized protein Rs2_41125 [Raphanus sativus]
MISLTQTGEIDTNVQGTTVTSTQKSITITIQIPELHEEFELVPKKQPTQAKTGRKITELRRHLEEMRPYELRNQNKNSMQQPNYKLSGGKGNTSPHGERNGFPPP